jgi:hypothetical protein
MHILLAIPTPEYSQSDFALGNLQDIIRHTHKKFPDWNITTCYKYGTRTDANRNIILKEALTDPSIDYILWLDSDMLYPASIIERYFDVIGLGQTIDVIGCLYFKRSSPYDPIAYEYNTDPETKEVKPFRTILPSAIREDQIIEIDGLGYGGMMVNMKVYEKLGDKKWTHYGENFHLPFEAKGHMTHDLVFCDDVKKAGMSIKIHGGVRPGHFCLKPITMEDWQRANEEDYTFKHNPPSVLVVMPATNKEQATICAEVMKKRAGTNCDIAVVLDDEHKGFIYIVNMLANSRTHDVICYTAQDVLVGENWLKRALLKMLVTNAGLVSFHDGKWGGRLASFGLVQRSWWKNNYNGELFYPGYWGNYADTELTQIAKQQGRYAYAERAVMLEVDFEKALGRGKGVVKSDKKLYAKRKKTGFDGLVTDKELIEEFR